MMSMHYIADLQPDKIAAAQLAVDRQVEHGQLSGAVLDLQANPDGPDFLQLEWRLWADQLALVPGFRRLLRGFVRNEKHLRALRCVGEPTASPLMRD